MESGADDFGAPADETSGERVVGRATAAAAALPYASPAVRRFARELGVDLSGVEGSGDRGRILRQDVAAFVKSVMTGTQPAAGSGQALPSAVCGWIFLNCRRSISAAMVRSSGRP
jgi:pyruvate/2-oxoglutarate dehydrogenase complex dihydrolipoamide acyltransferase (E2) component